MISDPALSIIDGDAIAIAAGHARELFRACQDLPDAHARSTANAQLTRFNLWASNIGVFAARQSSLDYRLRTAPTPKAAVEGNLDLLCKHLLTAFTGDSELAIQKLDGFRHHVGSTYELGIQSLKSSVTSTASVVAALKQSDRTISNLHKLSLAIRKASNRHMVVSVPELVETDSSYSLSRFGALSPTGEVARFDTVTIPACSYDATQIFEDYVSRVLRARWGWSRAVAELSQGHEGYRRVMLQRCVSAITVRRRQLQYFERHQKKLEYMEDIERPVAYAVEKSRLPTIINSTQTNSPRAGETKNLQESTEASEFVSQKFTIPPSETIPSSTTYSITSSADGGALRSDGSFEVPPPPELLVGETEKACPYCRLVLPQSIYSTKKHSRRWRQHLLEDLQPYVCLHRACKYPGRSYRTAREWQLHLRQPHGTEFSCQICSVGRHNRESSFASPDELFRHVNLEHPQPSPSAQDIPYKAFDNSLFIVKICFVCGKDMQSAQSLQNHVGDHLTSAFLLALPAREDLESGAAASIATSGRRSSVLDSKTMVGDIERLFDNNRIMPDAVRSSHAMSNEGFAEQLAQLQQVNLIDIPRSGLSTGRDHPEPLTPADNAGPTRLLNVNTLIMEEFTSSDVPPYGILSHAWTADEVQYPAWQQKDEGLTHTEGYRKIKNLCEQAQEDGLSYVWADTCCLDRANRLELSHAINSMFSFFASASRCYVHLADIFMGPGESRVKEYANDYIYGLRHARWFTRGWTLLELIAPQDVQIFDSDWSWIGSKHSLAVTISEITGIDPNLLRGKTKLDQYSVAQKMSWAAFRNTVLVEDMAYSLMNLFGVELPMEYDVGQEAFQRLQRRILEQEPFDDSIFAWQRQGLAGPQTLLASSPADFRNCLHVTRSPGVAAKAQVVATPSALEVTVRTRPALRSSTDSNALIWLLNCVDYQRSPLALRIRRANNTQHFIVHSMVTSGLWPDDGDLEDSFVAGRISVAWKADPGYLDSLPSITITDPAGSKTLPDRNDSSLVEPSGFSRLFRTRARDELGNPMRSRLVEDRTEELDPDFGLDSHDHESQNQLGDGAFSKPLSPDRRDIISPASSESSTTEHRPNAS